MIDLFWGFCRDLWLLVTINDLLKLKLPDAHFISFLYVITDFFLWTSNLTFFQNVWPRLTLGDLETNFLKQLMSGALFKPFIWFIQITIKFWPFDVSELEWPRMTSILTLSKIQSPICLFTFFFLFWTRNAWVVKSFAKS